MPKCYLFTERQAPQRGNLLPPRPFSFARRLKDHCTLAYVTEKYGERYQITPLDHWPSMEELKEAVYDGTCPVAGNCGCYVETDGHCPHGCPSWLLALGMI